MGNTLPVHKIIKNNYSLWSFLCIIDKRVRDGFVELQRAERSYLEAKTQQLKAETRKNEIDGVMKLLKNLIQ